MKAIMLVEPGKLEVINIPEPVCPENGMLVKIAFCAICSTDVYMFRRGHRALKYPVVPGHEISGTVIKVSHESNEFKVGDRVVVGPGINCGACQYCLSARENLCPEIKILGFNHPGGMAEYLAVPARMIDAGWIRKIPDNVTLEEATLAEPLACCINGIEKLDIARRSKVLIIGGGPIGCLFAWLLRGDNCKQVIIAEKDPRRRSMVEELRAAHETIDDLKEIDTFDVLILACRYFPDAKWLSTGLAKEGQILLFSGTEEEFLNTSWIRLVHYNEWKVFGAYGCRPSQLEKALVLMKEGLVPARKLIDNCFSPEDINEAFGLVESNNCLKVLIKF